MQSVARLAECSRDRQEEADQINMVEGKLVSSCTECAFFFFMNRMRFLDSESCRETKGPGVTVRLVVCTSCFWVDAALRLLSCASSGASG